MKIDFVSQRKILSLRFLFRLSDYIHTFYTACISEGRKRIICGKIIRTARMKNSIIRKGIIPLKISSIDMSVATLCTTYTFKPTGGVIRQASSRGAGGLVGMVGAGILIANHS